jgi:hypothetical protein
MKKSESQKATASAQTPSQLIDGRIAQLADWRGETLGRLRALIHEADPDVVEDWKWHGVPTWYHDGILFTGETYKAAVKMTFAKGASLADPAKLFNASLDGNVRRAIDFHEGDKINDKALKALIRAAVSANQAKAKPVAKAAKPAGVKAKPAAKRSAKPAVTAKPAAKAKANSPAKAKAKR